MEINKHTLINELLAEVPEAMEQLYPYREQIKTGNTIADLAQTANISCSALLCGLQRVIKRATLDACDYEVMKRKLIKSNAVNVAGYVAFLWQHDFVAEMKRKAGELNIELNIQIFQKHQKKQFQNYLALCESSDDLPDLLIGKGFSSLMTHQFVDRFVNSGIYQHSPASTDWGTVFKESNIKDADNHYHPFGVEEMVMLYDKTATSSVPMPECWSDILEEKYKDSIMQMGKNRRDHFGFNMMLFLYANWGEEAIRRYASNVKDKKHFSSIIRNVGSHHQDSAPLSVVHQFTSLFVRSDVRQNVEVVKTKDGNPVSCYFYLAKNNASDETMKMAEHLYSPQVKSIIEKCGSTHITSNELYSGAKTINWIGWDKLKSLPMPFLKEHLSEIAYEHYKAEYTEC
nr:ABC transporter substrate-binding protein [uncultured Carboxylicivirga sp.]